MQVRLVKPDLELIDLAIIDPAALGRALDCEVADEWFVFPGALLHTREAIEDDPESIRWGSRLFMIEDPPTLAGLGGFKGAPKDGIVELGYAVAPELQGRGIATAAVTELINDAFADPLVTTIIAHTLADGDASQRVLEKNHFIRDGHGPTHEGTATWRYRFTRPA